jgi:hypothetical protein
MPKHYYHEVSAFDTHPGTMLVCAAACKTPTKKRAAELVKEYKQIVGVNHIEVESVFVEDGKLLTDKTVYHDLNPTTGTWSALEM